MIRAASSGISTAGDFGLSLPLPILPDPPAFAEMHRAIGEGMMRWQYIESGLFVIAHGLMRTEYKISSLAFFQIKSGENKLAFVDRLIFETLKQHPRVKFWKPIYQEVKEALDFRNDLAHFEIFCLDEKHKAAMEPPTKYPVAISSNHLDEHKRRHGGMIKALSVELIKHNSEALRRTAYALIYFAIDHVPDSERSEESFPHNLRQYLGSFRKRSRPPGFEQPQKNSHP